MNILFGIAGLLLLAVAIVGPSIALEWLFPTGKKQRIAVPVDEVEAPDREGH